MLAHFLAALQPKDALPQAHRRDAVPLRGARVWEEVPVEVVYAASYADASACEGSGSGDGSGEGVGGRGAQVRMRWRDKRIIY